MKKISFSHSTYVKFWLTHCAVEHLDVVELVGVSVCDADKLPDEFKEFDSNYGTEEEPEYYSLPKGKVIVLFFWIDGDLFPTIRRWTLQKEEYYRGSIGHIFVVNIIGDDLR